MCEMPLGGVCGGHPKRQGPQLSALCPCVRMCLLSGIRGPPWMLQSSTPCLYSAIAALSQGVRNLDKQKPETGGLAGLVLCQKGWGRAPYLHLNS